MPTSINRRKFMALATASAGLASNSGRVLAKGLFMPPKHPDSRMFESGDFIWPKPPHAIIPKIASKGGFVDSSETAEEGTWLREKADFIARARKEGTYLTPAQLETLEKMTFSEFYAQYTGSQEPRIAAVPKGAAVYVGHVGIISIELERGERVPWVIEALWHPGVVKRRYQDWIKERNEEWVWLGRVRDVDAKGRQSIATESETFIGRPYNFWNFDLGDDRNFYCSKLVWLSIWRSLEFAIDGKDNPKRNFWFSPKQLLNSHRMNLLFKPGTY